MRHRGARRRVVATATTLAVVLTAAPIALADDFVEVPPSPAAMLVDTAHDQIYLTRWDDAALTVLDAAGNAVTTVPMDTRGLRMDVVGDTVFVSLPDDDSVAMIDVTTNALLGYLELPGRDPGPIAVAGGRVWFTSTGMTGPLVSVSIGDPTDIVEYPFDTDLYPWAPALVGTAADPDLLLATGWVEGVGIRLYLFDMSGADPVLLDTHDAGEVEVPQAVFSPDGTRIYYAYTDHVLEAGGIVELQTSTMSEVDTYPAPGSPGFTSVAVSHDGNHIAGAEQDDPAALSVFAHGAATPVRTFTAGPTCGGATAIADQLAFSAMSDQLVALYVHERSLLTFFDDPTIAGGSSSIALTTPSSAAPGDVLDITGTLSVDVGTDEGRAVEIWAGVGASAFLVDTVLTSPGGTFSAQDVAEITSFNRHCYTARYVGDPSNSSASAVDVTDVAQLATTVVIDDPTPSNVAPTDEVTVTGQVTFEDENPPTPPPYPMLQVSRVPVVGGASSSLPEVPVDDDGTFEFTDTLDLVGDFYYQVVAPESERYNSGFGNSAEVTVAQLAPVVTLTPANGNIRYGGSVTVRIQLPADATDRNVVLTEKQVGKPKITIFDSAVPAAGKSFVRSPKANATYELVWGGDPRYLPKTKTGKVWVHAIVTGVLKRALRQQGAYKIYRKGSIAYFPVTVTPNHGSKLVEIDVDKQVSGTWRNLVNAEFHLHDSTILVLLNTGALRLGVNFRIRAVFSDADHAVGRSPFRYFRLVA
jgi:hypothetical protein